MRMSWGYQGNVKTIVTSREAFSNISVGLKSGEDELGPQSSKGLPAGFFIQGSKL